MFSFPISLVTQALVDPAPLAKKRKIKKIWIGVNRYYVNMKGPRPNARRRRALPRLLPLPPLPQNMENEKSNENSTNMEIDGELSEEEYSSSEYDPDTMTSTYKCRNPNDDVVEPV
jgi:hypothetical protein